MTKATQINPKKKLERVYILGPQKPWKNEGFKP